VGRSCFSAKLFGFFAIQRRPIGAPSKEYQWSGPRCGTKKLLRYFAIPCHNFTGEGSKGPKFGLYFLLQWHKKRSKRHRNLNPKQCDGARIWNDLPSDVTSRSAPSLAVFGRQSMTELFRRCYNAAWLLTFFPLIVVLEMEFLFRPL